LSMIFFRKPLFSGSCSRDRRLRPAHGLADLEAFELRVLEVKRAGGVIAGARVCGTKRLRPGPGLECRLALPDRVRGIELDVLSLGTLEQMEFDEARNLVQVGVAIEPDLLKGFLRPALHTEAIHRDEHGLILSWQPGSGKAPAGGQSLNVLAPYSAPCRLRARSSRETANPATPNRNAAQARLYWHRPITSSPHALGGMIAARRSVMNVIAGRSYDRRRRASRERCCKSSPVP